MNRDRQYNLNGNWVDLDEISFIGKIEDYPDIYSDKILYYFFEYIIDGILKNIRGHTEKEDLQQLRAELLTAWKEKKPQ